MKRAYPRYIDVCPSHLKLRWTAKNLQLISSYFHPQPIPCRKWFETTTGNEATNRQHIPTMAQDRVSVITPLPIRNAITETHKAVVQLSTWVDLISKIAKSDKKITEKNPFYFVDTDRSGSEENPVAKMPLRMACLILKAILFKAGRRIMRKRLNEEPSPKKNRTIAISQTTSINTLKSNLVWKRCAERIRIFLTIYS